MGDQSLGKMKNHGDTEGTEEIEISLAGNGGQGKMPPACGGNP